MHEKAAALGATHSHFVTPHGLHEDDHYTTVYDMYLIFQAAVQNETFLQIISTPSYDVSYTGADETGRQSHRPGFRPIVI